MINVFKADLENIGLQVTTMNIADIDDHWFPGVNEPDLYIALLKRIQSANAETRAREAQAESKAAAAEQAKRCRESAERNCRGRDEKSYEIVIPITEHSGIENKKPCPARAKFEKASSLIFSEFEKSL